MLEDLGMGIAFTDFADLSGINGVGGLKISKVIHKSFIEVDEAGTEAAAVTVVEVVETLGSEIQLDVASGEHSLVARVDPRTKAKRHQEIELAVNMDKIHIFETESPNTRIKTEEESPI